MSSHLLGSCLCSVNEEVTEQLQVHSIIFFFSRQGNGEHRGRWPFVLNRSTAALTTDEYLKRQHALAIQPGSYERLAYSIHQTWNTLEQMIDNRDHTFAGSPSPCYLGVEFTNLSPCG